MRLLQNFRLFGMTENRLPLTALDQRQSSENVEIALARIFLAAGWLKPVSLPEKTRFRKSTKGV
jgi:hypothetical protein